MSQSRSPQGMNLTQDFSRDPIDSVKPKRALTLTYPRIKIQKRILGEVSEVFMTHVGSASLGVSVTSMT